MDTTALRLAIKLLHLPAGVRRVQGESLPPGMDLLLGVVAGEPGIEQAAALQLERPAQVVRDAAVFFVEQVLLSADSDSYRVLGAAASAPPSELRRNMALLLRGLHPDTVRSSKRMALIERVTLAWEDLKTPERRSAYDFKRASRDTQPKKPAKSKHGRSPVGSKGRVASHRSPALSPGSAANRQPSYFRQAGMVLRKVFWQVFYR